MVFPVVHVWMWELDYKESWALKNWCFWTVVLEKTLESPLDYKEIQPVHLEISPEYSLEGLMLKLKLQHWSPDVKSWLIGKDPDAGKDWRREEKGMPEDEMVGWHHRQDRHEFQQAPKIGNEQGSLGCCRPWGRNKSDMTEQLNWPKILVILPSLLIDIFNGQKIMKSVFFLRI